MPDEIAHVVGGELTNLHGLGRAAARSECHGGRCLRTRAFSSSRILIGWDVGAKEWQLIA